MEKFGINFTNLDNIALVNIKNNYSKESVKYKELLKEIIKTTLVIEEFDVPRESTIGILAKKNFQLVALTIGIIESDLPFCYINEDPRINLIDFNSRFLFSELQMDQNHFKLLKTITIFGKEIFFYKLDIVRNLRTFEDGGDKMFKLCYVIKTSGTSGRRKIVHVTFNSIASNITSLQRIFQLDSSDVILSVSPISFDPFIVDLFLSLRAGSSLMFVDDSLRFDSNLFVRDATGVTFLQTTPSLFQQYGIENIYTKILSDDSTLKYLVLGGEPFPLTNEIKKWQNWDSPKRKRIFNIYGITEMSCWATIHEVTKEDFSDDKIPLGNALDDTDFAYYSTPENFDKTSLEELVLISKTRVCFIDNSDVDKNLKNNQGEYFAQNTGDLVKRINGKIYWHGRTNDMIKRFGEKVNLSKIEACASEYLESSRVACVFVKKRIILSYESSENLNEQLYNHFKNKLTPNEIPDDVRRVDFLPMNEHGKISKEDLRELYREIYANEKMRAIDNVEDLFLDAINQMFNLKLSKPSESSGDEPDGKRIRSDIYSTFNQLGGKSFDALRITMKIENIMNVTSNGLLPKLLDNQHTIKELCEYLTKLVPKNESPTKTSKFQNNLIQELHTYDLKKCVDSSPALLEIEGNFYISVGSHSSKLININASTLSITSQIIFDDRIECEVAQFKNFGVVGCYDGNLYCFDVLKGEIKWKFQSNFMIKSKPLVIDDLIIFGNYDYSTNLRCIKINENKPELVWSKMLGKLGIIANLLKIEKSSMIVATLSSTVHKIDINGNEIWKKSLDHPIFSSPQKIPNKNEFLVAEVAKNIHCIDFDGNTLWTYDKFNGQIFSSFLFISESDKIKIIFGSHDKMLRCLNYKDSNIDLEWIISLQSQIFSTPKVIKLNDKEFIISCSTSGYVNFINLTEGSLEYSKQLPGDIFSSPLVYKNLIFIGCRDNFVYTLKF